MDANINFLFFLLPHICVGVSPKSIFAKVNDTFKITCGVYTANGKLNFFDGDDPVPELYIKVNCLKFNTFISNLIISISSS